MSGPDLISSGVVPLLVITIASGVLMPAGFFLSVIGRDPARPNRLRYLIYLGAAALGVGLAAAGVGLITAGVRAG